MGLVLNDTNLKPPFMAHFGQVSTREAENDHWR